VRGDSKLTVPPFVNQGGPDKAATFTAFKMLCWLAYRERGIPYVTRGVGGTYL
jgi:hypothetical protein